MAKVHDKILNLARNNHGVVTTTMLRDNAIDPAYIRKLAQNDESVTKLTRGVYVIWEDPEDKTDYKYTNYAYTAAAGGHGAFLYGDTVLAMFDLGNDCPPEDYVAVPRYTTSERPEIKKFYYKPKHEDEVKFYQGIPVQNLKYAIPSAIHIRPAYKYDAANEALNKRLINRNDYNYINQTLKSKQ
jgi:predicted transcriptional regulator of viral defense system